MKDPYIQAEATYIQRLWRAGQDIPAYENVFSVSERRRLSNLGTTQSELGRRCGRDSDLLTPV